MISKTDNQLSFLSNALNLRAQRQQLLASNIANADTPNYKAVDINFAQALQHAKGAQQGRLALDTSNTAHLQSPSGNSIGAPELYRAVVQPSIDGNTVDMDVERAQFTENAIHYQFLIDRLNGQFKTMQTALQGQ